MLWPPDAKSWLIGEDPNARKDWGREGKEAAEDEMALIIFSFNFSLFAFDLSFSLIILSSALNILLSNNLNYTYSILNFTFSIRFTFIASISLSMISICHLILRSYLYVCVQFKVCTLKYKLCI